MIKVSVIIPCFNHGKYVDEAVNSILKQTYQDFEIIIIDDGSTDSFTIKKLKSYNKPKTKVIRTKNNGLPAARNKGIQEAKGEYILTLDADDKFDSSFLKKAVKILDNNQKIGVITCMIKTFGLLDQIWYPKGGGIQDFLIENNCCSSALFRKACWSEVGAYDEKMKNGCEDWNFWIGVTARGWRIYCIKEPLFFYRVSKNAMHIGSDEKRPELVRQIVINNKHVYQKHVSYVIYKEEKKIETIFDSESYKIGRRIIAPIVFVRDIGRMLLFKIFQARTPYA